jgi:hypothetical protein
MSASGERAGRPTVGYDRLRFPVLRCLSCAATLLCVTAAWAALCYVGSQRSPCESGAHATCSAMRSKIL